MGERGVGLRNVERCLACQYGQDVSMAIRTSPGQGTAIEIRLPVPVWIEEPVVTVEG